MWGKLRFHGEAGRHGREKLRAKHAAGCGCLTNRQAVWWCTLPPSTWQGVHRGRGPRRCSLSWALVPIKKWAEKLSYSLQPLLKPAITGYFTIKAHKHLVRLWNINPSSKMLKIYLRSFCIAWSQKADLKAFKIPFKLQFHSSSLLLPPRENTKKITLEGLRL